MKSYFRKGECKRIIVDKISINIGIFSSLFGETVFDLIAVGSGFGFIH